MRACQEPLRATGIAPASPQQPVPQRRDPPGLVRHLGRGDDGRRRPSPTISGAGNVPDRSPRS